MPPAKPDPTDAIKPVLEQAEANVSRHLEAASEAESKDISQETSYALRALEDELLAAVRAIEQTVTIRHVIERSAVAECEQDTRTKVEDPSEERPCLVREFKDRGGRMWRGWQVVPGRARSGKGGERLLGAFAGGWLVFETLHGDTRKRLLTSPEGWASRSEAELVDLLERAIEVVPRKGTRMPIKPPDTPPADREHA